MEKLTELKVKSYDLIVQLEQHQQAIQQIQQELQKLSAEIQKEQELKKEG